MGNRNPIRLVPAAKDYLWGGSRLNDDFGLQLDADPLAEAWVCSTHPDGPSSTESGVLLAEILKRNPEWLGTHVLSLTNGKPELPILVKLIDAKNDLSVQVHPDDEYALLHENSYGKTEMWYVLDSKPGAELIYGFNSDVSASEVQSSITKGSIRKLLNHVPVQKGDVFFVNSGIVHAIGAGCLIAEIQQNSNLTYRLYDYDRTDKDGNKRPLHVEKALEVAILKSSAAPRQTMRVLKYRPGYASELLSVCKYFRVERMLLNTEIQRNLVNVSTGLNSFHALLCLEGCGSISSSDFMMNFFKGDCIFIPAGSEELWLHGKAQLLNVSC